jgi:hypothetical protein
LANCTAALQVLTVHPFFHALLTDDAGRLWVREANETDLSMSAVYEEDGRLLRPVQAPRRFRPTRRVDAAAVGYGAGRSGGTRGGRALTGHVQATRNPGMKI